MLDRVFRGRMLRVAAAAFIVSLAVTPAAFAKGGNDNGGHNDNGGRNDDHRSIPNCSRDRHDDDHGGRGGGMNHLKCPGKQVVVRTDEKVCPEKPNRPASLSKRVCCKTPRYTYCHSFPPCPPRSRS